MLGIIINPKSGKRAFRAQRVYLWKLLRQRREPFIYRVTKYAEHAIELGRELAERGCDEILVLGGDGTLSEVINGIMRANITAEERSKICFGLMPRGTGNDWGRFWGLSKDYKKALERFFNGKRNALDVGCVTYWRNGIEHHRYFINSTGFGIDSMTCLWAATLKYYIGSHHVNYLFALLTAIWVHKPQRIQLVVDGKEIVNDMLFTMNIGNGPFSGGGIRQNPDADPQDGVFHSIFVKKPTFRQVLRAVPRLFDGRLAELEFIHSFVGKEVELNTRHHLMFEADGILENIMGPCKITCMHNVLSMKC